MTDLPSADRPPSQVDDGGRAGWFEARLPVRGWIRREFTSLPMPRHFSYFWSFGALAIASLLIMMISGVFLAMHYMPHADLAFGSVEHIRRDVNNGGLLRDIHATGASMFFVVIYIHLFRGLYYGSYKAPRELAWMGGLVLWLLMMATAFTGYVLPWGQMSYWAATVVTDLFSALPWGGEGLVQWVRGGYAVGNPTLNRFFSLHFLLPFLISLGVVVHVAAVHVARSGNALGVEVQTPKDTVPFYPYYTARDAFALCLYLVVFAVGVFFAPDLLRSPENYIPANPLVTPADIVPEWYFLPFYAMLRAVPGKMAGVVVVLAATMVLFAQPWLDTSPVRSARFRPLYRPAVRVLAGVVVVLGIAGAHRPESGWLWISRICVAWYFFHFLVVLPVLGKWEKPQPLPDSIDAYERARGR